MFNHILFLIKGKIFLKYLWKEICDEILTETNQEYATPKLITQLMYAFRDIQV